MWNFTETFDIYLTKSELKFKSHTPGEDSDIGIPSPRFCFPGKGSELASKKNLWNVVFVHESFTEPTGKRTKQAKKSGKVIFQTSLALISRIPNSAGCTFFSKSWVHAGRLDILGLLDACNGASAIPKFMHRCILPFLVR